MIGRIDRGAGVHRAPHRREGEPGAAPHNSMGGEGTGAALGAAHGPGT